MQQENQAGAMDRMRSTANLVAAVAAVFATFAQVTFFRHTFGVRYFRSFKTALVVPVLFFFPIFWSRDDPRWLWALLALYSVMCIRHRLNIWRRIVRGESGLHSMYDGISRLERFFPKASEQKIKSFHEPAWMFFIGIGSLAVSPELGCFFILCAFGMGVQSGLMFAHDRQRTLDLADAQIEGQLLAGSLIDPAPTLPPQAGVVVRIHRSVVHPERKTP